MATLGSLLEEELSPSSACLPVTCGNCAHFRQYPLYRVGGRAVVCSNDAIGRLSEDTPCPHFAIDTGAMRDLTPAQRTKIYSLMQEFGLHKLRGIRKHRKEAAAALENMSLLFFMLAQGLKENLTPSGKYASGDVTGELVAWNKKLVVLQDEETSIAYTVDKATLEEITD